MKRLQQFLCAIVFVLYTNHPSPAVANGTAHDAVVSKVNFYTPAPVGWDIKR